MPAVIFYDIVLIDDEFSGAWQKSYIDDWCCNKIQTEGAKKNVKQETIEELSVE